uniref:FHA domain-containing protein n=1 Tax=Strongyloides papillosus TaxID=174720 RepID=A0A0N5CFB7_STREA
MGRDNSKYVSKRKYDSSRKYSRSSDSDYEYKRHRRHRSNSNDSRSKVDYKKRSRSPKMSSYDRKRNYDKISESGDKWGKPEHYKEESESKAPVEKDKPNFGTSGKLCEDTNTFKGVVVKYSEPHDAAMPTVKWRLYPFKGDEALPQIYIHRQSAYLIGKDRKVADFPIDHPSCSKQHAAFQYRNVKTSTGSRKVLLYIIDLGSTNGTFLNGEKIESSRYYELKEKDVLKFGFSSREYVVLSENMCQKDVSEDKEDSDDDLDVDLTGVDDKIKQENSSNDYGL